MRRGGEDPRLEGTYKKTCRARPDRVRVTSLSPLVVGNAPV
jgi:hypothetical protein